MEANQINSTELMRAFFPTKNNSPKNSDFSTILSMKTREYFNIEAKKENSAITAITETNENKADPVFLGEINESNPTVSELLIKNPIYGKDCWNIIYSDVNKAKSYRKIMPGTKIYISPETLEINWKNQSNSLEYAQKIPQNFRINSIKYEESQKSANSANTTFSDKLADAVKPFLGTPYNKIDCYELIISGLEKLGIKYNGFGGLKRKLEKMALDKGLAQNSYLNGEGLIESSGSKIYGKSFIKVNNPDATAKKVSGEMENLLEKGCILSFSTPTKGHTGVISKSGDIWTFINSGNLDNRIDSDKKSKGVGEENLGEEIKNWLRLAYNRNEPLKITMGKLNDNELAQYYKPVYQKT
ncbi:MAG: hypothetical protein HQK76_17970 [Desulfobacterales bacterium]|nr:hypothetical protein [Desulfobacterales bacterium]